MTSIARAPTFGYYYFFDLGRYLISVCPNLLTCKVGIISTSQGCEDQMTQLSNQHHVLFHSRHSKNFVFLSLLPTR